ncbi:MAG: YIP1 family protein [Muribaculaceae bacterium]|nr:YIP1 family protein [Muribaculaceae bacterium]
MAARIEENDHTQDYGVDTGTLYDLESENEDNLYSLPEDGDGSEADVKEEPSWQGESEEDDDNEVYNLEDDEEDEDYDDEEDAEEDEQSGSKGGLISLMIKILSTPVEGWKELKRRKYSPDEVASGCFFPMTAFAAISEFAAKIYTNITVSECLIKAVFTFISFFFGYFTIMLLCGVFLPSSVKDAMKKELGKEFVMMNLSTLALFLIAINIFPMIDAVLVFLPLWTIYLIYKGVKILRVPPMLEARVKAILVFLIIGIPLFWDWLLDTVF